MPPSSSAKPRLSRNVVALGFVSLLTDTSTEIVYPLLPGFVRILGAGPGFLGVIEGVAETTASLLRLAAGWLSDRLRRRKAIVLLGYGLSSSTRPLMALAAAPWHVLLVRFLDRVGKGLRGAPRDALIADSTDPALRGRAFGFHRAMDHAGAVAGPLIAFLLLQTLFQTESPSAGLYRAVFWAAVLPAALAVLTLALSVQEVVPTVRAPGGPTPLLRGKWPRGFRPFLVALILFTLGNSSDAFLLWRAQDLGVAPALIPLLWAALHLVKSLSSTPGSGLSDRIGRRPTLLIGWTLYGLVYLGFAFAGAAWHVWALFALYGLYFGFSEGTEKAFVADLVSPDLRARAYGWHGLAVGMTALPSSVLMGWLWQTVSVQAAFLFGAGCALAGMLLLACWPSLRSREPVLTAEP
ncbi:MAG: MFS transporter [Candidatus Poribacteria bacterium]|nr:MAG: MFS transporter [Candidatus Poribacteria bacterium]